MSSLPLHGILQKPGSIINNNIVQSLKESDYYRTAELTGLAVGTLSPSSRVYSLPILQSLTLPADCIGSKAMCYTAPSSEVVFTLKKVVGGPGGTATSIATFRFAASSKVASFDTSSMVNFLAGDILEIHSPSDTFGLTDLIFGFGVMNVNSTNPNIPAPGNIVSIGKYRYTGTETLIQIPEGVTKMFIKAWGAGGGKMTTGSSGGAGGYAEGLIENVVAGTQISIKIGGVPPAATNSGYGNGGGGMTSIKDLTNNVYLLIAAGGGGGVYHVNGTRGGAGGGLVGQAGEHSGSTPGTQSAGGTTGGSQYQGGNGTGSPFNPGGYNGGGFGGGGSSTSTGGGGGGFFGGGGSSVTYRGGAGGSSMIPSGGLTIAGVYEIAPNTNDPDRDTAGNSGTPGIAIITYME